jgi:hypothetical protein
MRSSKSRSRSKSNRNRSMGNIVNRVFDSSGPEGKVRGTPQQIIEKYNQLARDAQLSNDRVAAENFQQHAEHYTRMLGEAMREQEAQPPAAAGRASAAGRRRPRRRPRDRRATTSYDEPPRRRSPGRGAARATRDEPRAAREEPRAPVARRRDRHGPTRTTGGLVETPESAPQDRGRGAKRARRAAAAPQGRGEGGRGPGVKPEAAE